MRDYLPLIKARHIFAIVDSCFSGHFFPETRAAGETQYVEALTSRYALTAERNEPVLDGATGANSPFAAAVRHYLSASPGSIGAVMLSEHVLREVSSQVAGFQTPRHGELNIKGNQHGQFFFHRRRPESPGRDVFVAQYFAHGGERILPRPWRSFRRTT